MGSFLFPEPFLFRKVIKLEPIFVNPFAGIYILAIPPPPGGGNFCPNLKTTKNLKEDLKKKRIRGEKKEKKKRVIKHTLN